MKDYLIQGETLRDIADAIREKTGSSEPMEVKDMADNIDSIGTGIELPTLNNEGTAADMLAGKQLISGEGSVVTGTIPTKTSSDLSVNGPSVTVPSGYYNSEATVSVATGSARMPATSITKAPTITVDDSGLITASVSGTKSVVPRITEGYVTEGTAGTITVKCSATEQLTTQAAKTITPGTSVQTAVAKNVYTTGAVTVEAIPSNYEDVTDETATYTNTLEQLGEAVAELEAAVNALPEGGGGSVSGGVSIEMCTGTLTVNAPVMENFIVYAVNENLQVSAIQLSAMSGGSFSVAKNTLFAITPWSSMSVSNGGVTSFYSNYYCGLFAASTDFNLIFQ